MKRTIKHKIRRFFKKIAVKSKRTLNPDGRAKYPKSITDKEKTISSIFLKILHDSNTEMYYNPETYECYLRSVKYNIYIFLESNNVTVINSVYGYEVKISQRLERYLSERFKHETAKRRNNFKEEAMKKVEHSLNITLDNINFDK